MSVDALRSVAARMTMDELQEAVNAGGTHNESVDYGDE